MSFFLPVWLEKGLAKNIVRTLKQLGPNDPHSYIEWALHRFLLPLYYKKKVEGAHTLFLVSTIWTDGVGDYFSLLRAAALLQQALTNSSIHIVFHHKQPLPSVDFTGEFGLKLENIHPFKETADSFSFILEPILEGVKSLPFEKEYKQLVQEIEKDLQGQKKREEKGMERSADLDDCIEENQALLNGLKEYFSLKEKAVALRKEMETSAAIIHISLAIDTFSDPLLKAKSLYFAESGNFQGVADSLHFNWFSMGLKPFEEGFFLRHWKPTETPSPAISLLFENEFLKKNSYFFAYFSSHLASFFSFFLYAICLWQQSKEKTITFLMPITALSSLKLDLEWLAALGFQEIALYDHLILKESLLLNQEGGKKIKIVNCFPARQADFIYLMSQSGPIVGCTGDGSLGECLGAKKLPFYQIRAHKTDTIDSIVELINSSAPNSSLIHYWELLRKCGSDEEIGVRLAKEIAECLEQPDLFSDWDKVLESVHSHFDLEKNLIGRIKRHLILQENKELKEQEEQIIQLILEAKEAEEGVKRLQNSIFNHFNF